MPKSKIILLAILALALCALLWWLPAREWLTLLQTQIKSYGVLAPVIYALVYIVATLLLIPGSVLTLGAGPLFGFWRGFLIVVISANLAALCAYLLARTALRQRVAQWAAANPKFAALDRAIGQNGFKMVLLSRLSPAFPFTLLNYLLGLTTVSPGAYLLANLIGMLPGTFLYVYLGATAGDALNASAQPSIAWGQYALRLVGLLATLGVVILVTRIARKAISEAEQEEAEQEISS
jgi:uncharacterized membrane protein YdjX (TVP38/TMEM64 family)